MLSFNLLGYPKPVDYRSPVSILCLIAIKIIELSQSSNQSKHARRFPLFNEFRNNESIIPWKTAVSPRQQLGVKQGPISNEDTSLFRRIYRREGPPRKTHKAISCSCYHYWILQGNIHKRFRITTGSSWAPPPLGNAFVLINSFPLQRV